MTKHDNYNNPCEIKIYKRADDSYVLEYQQESWSLMSNKEELLEELSEHLSLMKYNKGE